MRHNVYFIIFVLTVTYVLFFPLNSLASTPYKEMLADPLSFTGIKNSAEFKEDTSVKPIVLGFLLSSSNSTTETILDAAKRVISNVNRGGGYHGRPLKIIHRSADKPWQSGASEILKLIYEDHAAVLFTSLSTESHLASQAAAKAFIPVVSILSADSTLNHAGIPWIRRLTPSYEIQADVLLKQLLRSGKNRTGLISMADRESRLAATAMMNALIKSGHTPLYHLQLAAQSPQILMNQEKIIRANLGSILIASSSSGLNKILATLNKAQIHCPLYLSWTPGLQLKTISGSYPGKIISVSPLQSTGCSKRFLVNVEKQQPESETETDVIFELAYDAVQLTVDAIMKRGPGAAVLQESISSITHYQGKYGAYLFDNGGANVSPPYICEY